MKKLLLISAAASLLATATDHRYDHDRHSRRGRPDRAAVPHQDQKLRH